MIMNSKHDINFSFRILDLMKCMHCSDAYDRIGSQAKETLAEIKEFGAPHSAQNLT